MDTNADTVLVFSADGELDSAPKFNRGRIVELGVKLKNRAAPYARRRWETEGNTNSDVGMGIEESLV